MTGGHGSGEGGQRAVPYACPFCAEEDLRPEEQGRWHCRSCLRLFSVQFHGVVRPATAPLPNSSSPATKEV